MISCPVGVSVTTTDVPRSWAISQQVQEPIEVGIRTPEEVSGVRDE